MVLLSVPDLRRTTDLKLESGRAAGRTCPREVSSASVSVPGGTISAATWPWLVTWIVSPLATWRSISPLSFRISRCVTVLMSHSVARLKALSVTDTGRQLE
jgi:hypothetical protein